MLEKVLTPTRFILYQLSNYILRGYRQEYGRREKDTQLKKPAEYTLSCSWISTVICFAIR